MCVGSVWGGSVARANTPSTQGASTTASIPNAAKTMSALGDQLTRLIDGYGVSGEYAVAVTDLQTGETIAVNGHRRALAACTINLLVLMQSTLDIQSGRTPKAAVDGLIAKTVYSSNAVTAHDLYVIAGDGDAREGVRRVGALMAEIGMTESVLDHPPAYGHQSLGLNPNNWVTPLDMNRVLTWLWGTKSLQPEYREYLLDHLTGVKPGLNYLTAIVPADSVSHKNGFFQATDRTYVDNDVAIVRFTRGGEEYAYAISFFSQWVPKKYADLPLGQQVILETWAFFDERYPD